MIQFNDNIFQIIGANQRVIAIATRLEVSTFIITNQRGKNNNSVLLRNERAKRAYGIDVL